MGIRLNVPILARLYCDYHVYFHNNQTDTPLWLGFHCVVEEDYQNHISIPQPPLGFKNFVRFSSNVIHLSNPIQDDIYCEHSLTFQGSGLRNNLTVQQVSISLHATQPKSNITALQVSIALHATEQQKKGSTNKFVHSIHCITT